VGVGARGEAREEADLEHRFAHAERLGPLLPHLPQRHGHGPLRVGDLRPAGRPSAAARGRSAEDVGPVIDLVERRPATRHAAPAGLAAQRGLAHAGTGGDDQAEILQVLQDAAVGVDDDEGFQPHERRPGVDRGAQPGAEPAGAIRPPHRGPHRERPAHRPGALDRDRFGDSGALAALGVEHAQADVQPLPDGKQAAFARADGEGAAGQSVRPERTHRRSRLGGGHAVSPAQGRHGLAGARSGRDGVQQQPAGAAVRPGGEGLRLERQIAAGRVGQPERGAGRRRALGQRDAPGDGARIVQPGAVPQAYRGMRHIPSLVAGRATVAARDQDHRAAPRPRQGPCALPSGCPGG